MGWLLKIIDVVKSIFSRGADRKDFDAVVDRLEGLLDSLGTELKEVRAMLKAEEAAERNCQAELRRQHIRVTRLEQALIRNDIPLPPLED